MDIDKEIAYGVTLQGLVDAVRNIQYQVFEQTDCEYYNVVVITDGDITFVTFIDIQIWCDQDEGDRMLKYDDIGNVVAHEPIEEYLRRAIMEEIAKLSKINL